MQICMLLFFSFLVFSPWVYRFFPNLYNVPWRREVMVFYFSLMGFLSFVVVYLVLAVILQKILWLGRRKTYKAIDPNRRLFLTQMFNMGILSLGGVSTAAGGIVNMRPPEIFQVNIPLKQMHDDLKDFTIVQISDLHIGLYWGASFFKMSSIGSIN